ncbi:3-dehydroquinate synthase [Mucilaginibacter mallensis]|uniref:3-dehydroquinate synthase n=1 Tax=Mucilaginibacter mallensis TaxID=652787 RepID=A0A1H1SVB7_MUCMA|nr:3-dehydroquinate synthase [Mucilaginibacter mallensis]SDS51798.1 3-dehydroquinate synthase [Mucilaginibacter mallensis]
MDTLHLDTINSIDYPIYFDNSIDQLVNFIKTGNYSRFFILTDENTAQHCLPLVKEKLGDIDNYDIIEINAGEESKDIDFCIGIWKMLIDFGADRKSLMVNLGGGVISDLGGFAASTFKRGIDFVHVPTTLLSQVDASVGGKTGIDIDSIKNIIGTFTQPKAVFIAYDFLKTLPERQVLSGLAEMLKHGLIVDADYWNQLKNSDLTFPAVELIYHSIEIKNRVVIEDPKENGIRKSLNFGHTVGHAVETYSILKDDGTALSHGEAIAIGMICEAWLSHKKIGLSKAELNEIVDVITSLYPKYLLEESANAELYALMQKDKKNQNGKINCTLLTQIGQYSIDNICTEAELSESLAFYATL